MQKRYLFVILSLVMFICFESKLYAQNLPVGTPVIEDMYRRQQLLGKVDSTLSFMIRPISASALLRGNIFDPDSSLKSSANAGIYRTKDGKGVFQLLPITLQQQYNTHNPYGWNDGAMIPANGYQTLFTAGFYAKYKFLSIQFQPEFVHAQNKAFDGFTQANNETAVWTAWYSLRNSIDMPERFGATAYTKLWPGQSSIRITFDPVSLGLSTESLWWGPGIRNSLIMSNNATSFPHITLNTTKPIHTPIGSIEAQIVSGKLSASGYAPLVPGQPGNRDALYRPKSAEWRYFNGMVVSYQPRWVPGLFLGLTRVFQMYNTDMGKGFRDYFPIFSAYDKSAGYDETTGIVEEDKIKRDQLTSVFARWLWVDGKAEIYFEYGKNDHNWNLRDVFLDPQHSRGYLLGFKKIYNWGHKADEHIAVSVETTHLAEGTNDYANRGGGVWYKHGSVRAGYTNRGEVMGAGIGPGGSIQTLDVSWFKGIKRVGLRVERFEHDADLYLRAFQKGELRRHWVDFSAGLSSDWDYKQFLFSARVIYVDQLNYQWQLKQDNSLFYWNQKRYDVNNFQFGLNVSYRF